MQQITRFMYATAITAAFFFQQAEAQLTRVADGGNKPAVTGERIGLTDVTIRYNRPGVKGREGQVWGKLIPTGYTDPGFGTSKAAPWRAGANENTTIEFSDNVKIDGQDLPAGKYALFVAYDPNECTVIFSKNSSSWGSFFYNDKEDAIRVKVKPMAMDKSVEWLKYEFINETENSATVALEWEKLMIPFKVEVDVVQQQLASYRRELRSNKGFTWNAWVEAAQYCINHKTNLDEALVWSETAISEPFVGEKNFSTLGTKAQVLELLGRKDEAAALMKEAMPMAKMTELHAYGRSLVKEKKNKEALEAFQLNYTKNPNVFTTNMGLARGYSANGDYKKSLEYAQKALAQAPDQQNRQNIEKAVQTLKEGKDFNTVTQ